MSAEIAAARFADGTPLEPVHPNQQTLDLLRQRRSAKWLEIHGPGPNADELSTLLSIASRVPDHGKIAPWRFIIINNVQAEAFGKVLARTWEARDPKALPERLALETRRFANMPITVVVVSCARTMHKIPVWEQELSAAAACTNLLIAANAMGYAGSWITEWFGYDSDICAALGMLPGEKVAGFVGLGTADSVVERGRPTIESLVSTWKG